MIAQPRRCQGFGDQILGFVNHSALEMNVHLQKLVGEQLLGTGEAEAGGLTSHFHCTQRIQFSAWKKNNTSANGRHLTPRARSPKQGQLPSPPHNSLKNSRKCSCGWQLCILKNPNREGAQGCGLPGRPHQRRLCGERAESDTASIMCLQVRFLVSWKVLAFLGCCQVRWS